MIEKILQTVENEVQWRLLELQQEEVTKEKEPITVNIFDFHSGILLDTKHAPICRCQACPFYDDYYMDKLRKSKKSPYFHWNLDPDQIYVDLYDKSPRYQKHSYYCECQKCENKPYHKIINIAKQTGRNTLRKSVLRRGDLYQTWSQQYFSMPLWGTRDHTSRCCCDCAWCASYCEGH